MPRPSAEHLPILERTNTDQPKAEDVAALRRLLHEKPELWRQVADLARRTQEQLIEEAIQAPALFRESLSHGVQEMRRELGYAESSLLERLAIEQVLLCWLDSPTTRWGYHHDITGGASIRNAQHWERRLNGAQRRYLRAIQALSRMRKLGPAVQINIAEQQVNVAG
jgi:hypothetical protein